MGAAARDGSGLRHWLRVVAYVLAIAAWLLFSIPRRGTDGTAYWLGQILGAAFVALSIPLVIRLVYWRIKDRRPAFWTPWIFALAAVLALFVRVNTRVSEEMARKDKAETLVARTSGPKSDDVRECVFGAIDEYETNYQARERMDLTEEQLEKLAVNVCQELERRDLFREGAVRRKLAVMREVMARMQAQGELPRE